MDVWSRSTLSWSQKCSPAPWREAITGVLRCLWGLCPLTWDTCSESTQGLGHHRSLPFLCVPFKCPAPRRAPQLPTTDMRGWGTAEHSGPPRASTKTRCPQLHGTRPVQGCVSVTGQCASVAVTLYVPLNDTTETLKCVCETDRAIQLLKESLQLALAGARQAFKIPEAKEENGKAPQGKQGNASVCAHDTCVPRAT